MSALPFAIGPLLAVSLTAIGAYVARRKLKLLAHSLDDERFLEPATQTALLESRPNAPMDAERPLEGRNLTAAIAGLIEFARRDKPDFILGIHSPGRMLSVLVADAIGMRFENCVYVGTTEGPAGGVRLYPSEVEISGRVLVVDDVIRSGSTLLAVKNFLLNKASHERARVEHISFAVLVANKNAPTNTPGLVLHWAGYSTLEYYYSMPWSDLSLRIRTADEKSKRNGVFLSTEEQRILELRRHLIELPEFALARAREYLGGGSSPTPGQGYLKPPAAQRRFG